MKVCVWEKEKNVCAQAYVYDRVCVCGRDRESEKKMFVGTYV